MEVFSQNYFPADQGDALSDHARTARALLVRSAAADRARRAPRRNASCPTLDAAPDLQTLLADGQRARFEREILPEFIRHCRWFGAKARTIRELRIVEQRPDCGRGERAILVPRSDLYRWRAGDLCACRCRSRRGEAAHAIAQAAPHAIIARFAGDGGSDPARRDLGCGFSRATFPRHRAAARLEGKVRANCCGVPGSSRWRRRKGPAFPGRQRRAKQFVDAVREQIFPETLSQTRGRSESRCRDHAIPDRAARIRACARVCRRDRISPRKIANRPSFVSCRPPWPTKAMPGRSRWMRSAAITSASSERKADLQMEHAPPGPLLEELIGGIYPEKAKLLGQAHGRVASRARVGPRRSRLRAGTVQCALAAFRLSKHARIVARDVCVAAKETARACRKRFERKRRKFWPRSRKFSRRNSAFSITASAATKIRIHGDYHLGQAL